MTRMTQVAQLNKSLGALCVTREHGYAKNPSNQSGGTWDSQRFAI